MSNFYDTLARMQTLLIQGNNKNLAGQGPFNKDGKVNFGTALDVAKNLPQQPTLYSKNIAEAQKSYNDAIESGRLNTINAVGSVLGKPQGILAGAAAGATLGTVVPGFGTVAGGVGGAIFGTAAYGIGQLDSVTDGKVSNALMSGSKGVRSNYAFVQDITRHNFALGILSTLGIIGAAVGGAALIVASGGTAAPAVAAGFLAAYGAGKAERAAAEAGAFNSIDKNIQQSAKYAQSQIGQERYNFGRDVTHLAANATGYKTLGDTSKGIGAVVSGIINFGFEVGTAPDIKAAAFTGQALRAATVGGITAGTEGPIVGLVSKIINEPALQAKRLAKDVDMIKRTIAGEVTPYTKVINFIHTNDVATVKQRIGLRDSEEGQIGAALMAGKPKETIGLLFRIGRGDAEALSELAVKDASTYAQLMRYEGAIEMVDSQGSARAAYGFTREDGSNIVLNKKLTDNLDIVKKELDALQLRNLDLKNMLKLDSALTQRTVSRADPLLNKLGIKGVESLRNDIALQRASNRLGEAEFDLTTRETKAGKIMQKIYTDNGRLGVIIRSIDRILDDAPHQTVNFNDVISSTTRVRTTIRSTSDLDLIAPAEGRELFNSFAVAKSETEKVAALEKLEVRVFEELGRKYNLPGNIWETVLREYTTIIKSNRNKAIEAKSENKAYMIDVDGSPIVDPQLISQLANGYYLPDVQLLDKAFKRYAKKMGEETSLPVNTAILGRAVVDEFQSVWRSLTLARMGFPINIMRDSTLRAWGDGALFYMMKDLSSTAIDNVTKSGNTITEIRNWTKTVTNKDSNLKYMTEQIEIHNNAIKANDAALKRAKYDATDPKTITPEVAKNLAYRDKVQSIVDGLKIREQQLISNKTAPTVGRESVSIYGYTFPKGGAGKFGKMSYEKLRGKDDLRGLLASSRELDMANIHRDRQGGHVIKPTQFNEKLHLKSWETVLNNSLRNDPVAEFIMGNKMSEKDIVAWIKSNDSGSYIDRFGYDSSKKRNLQRRDAQYIYDRVLNTVNQFAPNSKLWPNVLNGTADVVTLKKLYPDWQSRPEIITDMAEDLLGQSNAARYLSNLLKDSVTWLATVPTSKLSYNPYFNAKYQHKLQNMVGLANAQGRKLTAADQGRFEATARSYALNEFRQKLNAFNRDMNYPGIMNYIMAFFPALVEQYRAYGKITMEHPEFPAKILAMSTIPNYLSQTQVDQFGTEYTEVTLPLLGIKGRLPVSWFNAVNPTGGHILSAGPLSAFTVNEIAKQIDLPSKFVDSVLPFGVQANGVGMLQSGTLRRSAQAYQAFFLKNGEQFNKDANMFIEMKRKEFMDLNHREPTGSEVNAMYKQSKKDATSLSLLRFAGAFTLPSQPNYVSPLQTHADLLAIYTKNYGQDGAERFSQDYPGYYLLADKLSSATSGIRSDKTALALVRKNGDVIEEMIAQNPKFDLTALGAVFNDDDYAFSSAAQAYLTTHAIPGTKTKFKEQGNALQNNTSSIVGSGWNKWNTLVEVVTQQLLMNNPPYSTGRGYGKVVLDNYKKGFIENMKTENNLWYQEKTNPSFGSRQRDVIDSLTIAANTPKLWADLVKQPRWHTLVNYLNFRYEIYDALKARGTTIDADKASDIRQTADTYVATLRQSDTNFGKFYDRYFDGDSFTHVFNETDIGVK